jgi:hypothetical protein
VQFEAIAVQCSSRIRVDSLSKRDHTACRLRAGRYRKLNCREITTILPFSWGMRLRSQSDLPSIRLRIWGSGVRILSGAPNNPVKSTAFQKSLFQQNQSSEKRFRIGSKMLPLGAAPHHLQGALECNPVRSIASLCRFRLLALLRGWFNETCGGRLTRKSKSRLPHGFYQQSAIKELIPFFAAGFSHE